MIDNAKNISCDILINPTDSKYDEAIRQFQGCPTIATTRGGRIFVGWYSGGTGEPHMDNYNLLIYSDDGGKTWSKPLVIIPSNRENFVHALDIQLWTDPDGKLHLFWVQNNTKPVPENPPEWTETEPYVVIEDILFDDFRHAEWEIVCDNPDAENPVFSKPRFLCFGFLRCKPTVTKNGDWLYFAYNQLSSNYQYYISSDKGKTLMPYEGAEKIPTPFDEAMAYEKLDGSIRMFARCIMGELAESISQDGGKTWSKAKLSGIKNPNARIYVSRTPSGKVILVNNDISKKRFNMTICLSDDDGETWKYKKIIDKRDPSSYPDVDFIGDKIYLTYDFDRNNEREILFLEFTENDIIDPSVELKAKIISKP